MEKFQKFVSAAFSYIPRIGIIDIVELIILCLVLYKILVLMKNTRAWIFAKGILVLLVFYAVADAVGFNVIKIIFHSLFSVLAILLVVLFQQELKKMIGEIGKRGSFWKLGKKKERQFSLLSEDNMDSIISAVKDMAEVKTGALILIERGIPLKEWSDTGIPVNADISRQMLVQIFEKNTPLHDGAVIIHNGRIESATCYLPLSKNEEINKSLGTRHRAGIGISEVTDALVIIVSEETGKVSTVLNGQISHGITIDMLKRTLVEIQDDGREVKRINPKYNLKVKIISVLATAVLWTVMTNVADPVVTKTVSNVPITIKNETAITSQGLSYHVLGKETVDVTIRGNRSVIDTVEVDDVYAYVDLEKLSISNSTEIIAGISIPNVTATAKEKMMNISVEDTKEADYDISIATEGTLSSKNYINSIILDRPSVKITGPVTKVNIIGNVEAKFNITNAMDGSTLYADIHVFDKNGVDMTDEVELSYKTASAKVDMYETKTVPLTVSVKCVSNSGEIISYTYDKNEITVAADELVLEATNTIFMEVPVNIDSSVDTTSFVKVINLADFLPNGIYLAEREHRLGIDVAYEKYAEVNITIPSDSISLINTEKKYSYEIEPVIVKVVGLRKDIESIQLFGEADMTGLEPGTHQVDVNVNNRYASGIYKTTVTISEGEK